MAISKVELKNSDGSTQVLVDLTGDTVTAKSLEEGKTAHNAKGDTVTGKMINTGTGNYIWRKYTVVDYTIEESSSLGSTEPSDVSGYFEDDYKVLKDETHGNYFKLISNRYGIEPTYALISGQTEYPKSIYKHNVAYYPSTKDLYYKLTLTDAERQKGTFLGYVSDSSLSAYPTDGEQDGYWYVKVEEGSGTTTPNLQSKTVTPSASSQTVKPDSGYDGLSQVTVNGDADLIASNIKSGVNIFGVTGTYTGSGSGGSSDNNIEAYHITSVSTPITFKRTDGDIKVWGYGLGKSSYTSTVYAFNGTGYYSGQSRGSPTHTNCTFSISGGTLQGLPSGLTAVDLLVTKGI